MPQRARRGAASTDQRAIALNCADSTSKARCKVHLQGREEGGGRGESSVVRESAEWQLDDQILPALKKSIKN